MSLQGETINTYWALQVAYDNDRLKPSARYIAQDLLRKFVGTQKGGTWEELRPVATPSVKQIALAEKLVAEGEAYYSKSGPAQIDTVQLGGEHPLKALQSLFAANPLKAPKVTLATQDGYSVEISKAGDKGVNPGHLYLKWGISDPIWYIGKITPGGKYEAKHYDTAKQSYGALKQCDYKAVIALVEAFAADPLKVAAESGKITGRCCFCNKKLDTYESTSLGYGPTCAKKWGKPHGKKAADDANTPTVQAYAPHSEPVWTAAQEAALKAYAEADADMVAQLGAFPKGQPKASPKAIVIDRIAVLAQCSIPYATDITLDIEKGFINVAKTRLANHTKLSWQQASVIVAWAANMLLAVSTPKHVGDLIEQEFKQVSQGPHAPLTAFTYKQAAEAYKAKMGYKPPITQHHGKWLVMADDKPLIKAITHLRGEAKIALKAALDIAKLIRAGDLFDAQHALVGASALGWKAAGKLVLAVRDKHFLYGEDGPAFDPTASAG